MVARVSRSLSHDKSDSVKSDLSLSHESYKSGINIYELIFACILNSKRNAN